MKPLIVLLLVFGLAVAGSQVFTGEWNWIWSGNFAMFLMLCFTAMGHFKFTEGMTLMLPSFIPFKRGLVYFTGVAEVLLGIGLLFPLHRHYIGIVIILLFVLLLPANLHAAIKQVDYEKATLNGTGIGYLWFRIPLQVFFIAWVFFFAVGNSWGGVIPS